MKIHLAALSVLALFTGRAHAVDIAACGVPVPAREIGVLQADLDCAGIILSCDSMGATACVEDPGCTDSGCAGVVLGDRATLQMNGHTIMNGAVFCAGRCSVSGPGTIAGGDQGGESLTAEAELQIDGGLDINGSGRGIIVRGPASLSDVSVTNCSIGYGYGIFAYKKQRLTNVNISNNAGGGVFSDRSVRGEGVTTNDNGLVGILADHGSLKVTGLTATGNGTAPSGMGGVVALGGRAKFFDSVVTGNFAGATTLDLFTLHRPLLVNSTCDHSQRYLHSGSTSETWGVCAQD